jgi:hydrogenase nickel incorporation protein HypA/HybF
MHEMSIASSILTAVATEARRYPGTRARRVGVRIGELAGLDPESLRFCFEALVKETDLEGLELEIELRSRRHRCSCGAEFAVEGYEFQCTRCGNLATECVSGDELELAYVEVEEHEPSAAGA